MVRFVGDCNTRDSLQLHEVKITKPQAKQLINDVCEHYNVSPPTLRYSGRQTGRNLGHYSRSLGLITIQKPGESYGTVIHELAHHVALTQYKGTGRLQSHGLEFKNTQRIILQYVKTHADKFSVSSDVFDVGVAAETKIDDKPVVTLSEPTVITEPKVSSTDKVMNSRNVAILEILKSNPAGMTMEVIGAAVNAKLGINRASWNTPMYELKKAGLVEYNKENKIYTTK